MPQIKSLQYAHFFADNALWKSILLYCIAEIYYETRTLEDIPIRSTSRTNYYWRKPEQAKIKHEKKTKINEIHR